MSTYFALGALLTFSGSARVDAMQRVLDTEQLQVSNDGTGDRSGMAYRVRGCVVHKAGITSNAVRMVARSSVVLLQALSWEKVFRAYST